MASPGESVDGLRQDALDVGAASRGSLHDQRVALRTEGVACRLVQVADGGADGPGLQLGPLLTQPAEAELRLAAALAPHQLVPFVEDDGLRRAEQLFRLGIAEQKHQGFRRRDKNLRW